VDKCDDHFNGFVLDQLADLRDITCHAMFGGYGMYRAGALFGIVHQGRLCFKAGEYTAVRYRSMGMKPFKPNRRQTLKSYYEVPAEIVESPEHFVNWSLQAAQR
jgi:DNA transformation protein